MCFAPQRRALFRHFFDIWTSKSGPSMVCFVHFHLEMCFAPQRRALFRHRNFKKWSEAGVFCTFSLGNVLRATTACTFSTSQLQKVVRHWCVLYILTWKCASRHNGVHFFISHLASWLRTRRFSEPTFRPSGATNHWKNTVNRDLQCFTTFLPFRAPASSFFWSFLFWLFSPLTLLTSAFQLSILSEVSLLNFLRSYAVGLVLNSFHSYPCYLQSSRSFYRLTKDLTVDRGKTRAPPKSQDFSDISRWNSGIALILLALTESGVAGQSGSATPQKMRIIAHI